jgi:hypothetical protein
MKDEPRKVIRVIKAFKTENATYDLDEIYGVRASLAKQFVKDGLVEIVKVDLEEDEEEEVETPTGPSWEDPELGAFHFGDFGYVKRVELPAFKAFNFRARRAKSPQTYPLQFDADTADQLPTPAAVALAKLILANHAALASKVADALWADFTGSGPDSGMYWHNDLDQVAQGMESGKPPRSARDLFKLMKLSEIRIKKVSRSRAPVLAELNFRAAFEEEHGVGVLTDGLEVLGFGYSGEAEPFKRTSPGKSGDGK